MTSRSVTAFGHMREAVGFIEGNVLRHECRRDDPVLLWMLLTDELAMLSAALRRMEERTQRERDGVPA